MAGKLFLPRFEIKQKTKIKKVKYEYHKIFKSGF